MAAIAKRAPKTATISSTPLRLVGLAVACLTFFLLLALGSYHASDPSFSSAGSNTVRNAAGLAGAFMADVLLQILGLASVLGVAVMGSWSWHLLRGHLPGAAWWRLTTLILALVSSATALSMAAAPSSWPITTGLGGYMGFFVASRLEPIIGAVMLAIIMPLTALLSGLFAGGIPLEVCGTLLRRLAALWPKRKPGDDERFWSLSRIIHQWRERRAEREDEAYASHKPVKKTAKTAAVKLPKPTPKPPLEDMLRAADAAVTRPPAKEPKKQESLSLIGGVDRDGFQLPALQLLSPAPSGKKNTVSEQALKQNARLLESVMDDFGVNGAIQNVRPGPVVTLYELEPAPGTKSSRVIGLADDIARSMSAISARIAVIPGMNAIGVELPNQSRETVYFRELLESDAYQSNTLQLPLVLGKDIGGTPIVVDLAKMPHLLVAGTTGSGKSVAINTMILSLLYRLTPAQCRFIMIDPKMLELSVYDGIPHLLSPVVTEPGKAVVALKWTVKEMESRYRLMSNLGVRNISGYNKKIKDAIAAGQTLTRKVQTGFDPETGKPIIEEIALDMRPLPFIVVIVDEMADLMLVAGKDIEGSIQRLAQMARAAGIHIIMATQRPSVDVITGVIKANFPTRISFQVTSKIDSRTILGEQGAEQLLGMGDMLYMAGGSRISRVHGAFVADKEVEEVVKHLRLQGEPEYVQDVTEHEESEGGGFEGGGEGGGDEADLYRQAIEVVTRDKKASTSYIQRRLKIGYNKAASLIEQMEREGIVSPANHSGKREILVES